MHPPSTTLRVLAMPRHACDHCAACCGAYRIGPLLPADIDRIEDGLPALRAAFPDQPLDEPFEWEDDEGRRSTFLTKRDGHCAFFLAGTGCVLHAELGAEQKPLVCQLFPLQLVQTEQGIRLGTRPTCLSDHRCWSHGPQVDGALIERMLALPEAVAERARPEGEAQALALLKDPEVDSGLLLCLLARRDPRLGPLDVAPWLRERLSGLFLAADEILGTLPEDELGPLHPRVAAAIEFAELRRFWEAQDSERVAFPELPERALQHWRDAVQRQVFLRQTRLFPGLPWALLAYIAAGRWAAAATQGASGADEPFDRARFGRLFSSLLMMLEAPRLQRSFVGAGPPFAS